MTPVISDDPQVKVPALEKVISYVQRTGWKPVSHPNQNLMVFQGPTDDLGQPIQLVLPRYTQLWDSSILLVKALNLIAEVEDKTPEEIRVAIQLKSDVNKASFESASSPLTGKALLQKNQELSHLPKQEVAKISGYYTVTKNNQTLINLTDFSNALLAARGIYLNPAGPKDGRGREPTYRVSVHKNGQIVIGASYTRTMGLKPGDEFEVKLSSKQILLSRIGDA